MTTLTINYIVNPFSGMWNSFMNFCARVGYARAAAHLASIGRHEEAKNCMLMADEIKANSNENLGGWV